MHIETLKTFRDLVETGSFSRAAQMNFVSQSAVSQQVKSLEDRYDCRLVERSKRRGVGVTDAGKVLYAACKDVLERFEAAENRLRHRPTAIAGTIRIATVYSIGLHELPPYVSRFMKAHPQVKVHLEYSRTNRICDACLDDAIDFGIVALPVRQRGLELLPWRDEPLVLVCAPGHRLAGRRSVSVSQLRGEDFIAFERDIPTRKTIDRFLRSHHVAVNTVMEFDNIETIKRSVEVGAGVSILPATTIVNELKNGLLARAAFSDGRPTRSVGVIHRRGRVLSAAASEFVRLLSDSRGLRR